MDVKRHWNEQASRIADGWYRGIREQLELRKAQAIDDLRRLITSCRADVNAAYRDKSRSAS